MKKHLILLMAAITFGLTGFVKAQPWMKPPFLNTSKSEAGFYDIQNAFYTWWGDKPYERSKGYNQFKRWEYIMEPKCFPDGKIPEPLKYYNEYKKFLSQPQDKQPSKELSSWLPLGLTSWSNGISGYNPGNGRLNAVTVDMQNRNNIYVAAPSGGIWKSNDGGMTWNTTFDTMPVLGTSAIAIHPADPDIIFIGTGDRDAWDTKGTGIYKSTDGGATWNKTGMYFAPAYRNFNKILINPLNPERIFAASSDGIYQTKNGGTTWQLVYNGGEVKDLKFKPNDTTVIYGSGSYFVRSANGGSSFTKITSGIPSDTVRIEIDVAKSNPNYVFAVVAKPDDTFEGLYRSNDSGLTFSARSNSPNILGYSDDGSDNSGQAWYDLAIAVSPTNPNEIFVGGINVWKSTDGGNTFTINTMWTTSSSITYIHCDIHSLNFYGDTLYCGSDGGIFYTADHGDTWADVSNGLGISQFYRMGGSESEPYKIIAGGQDIGSNLLYGNHWTHVYGADGMEGILHPTDHYTLYISSQNGGMKKSDNNGEHFHNARPFDTLKGSWVTPYVMDPVNGNKLWAGFQEVYSTTDGAENWTQLSNNLTGGSNLQYLVVAPSDNNYIYAARTDKLYITTNGGATWSTRIPYSGYSITGIAVDPYNPSKIWLTLTSSNSDKVLYSKNAGAIFSNITGNLTSMGFNCIAFQKNSINGLYVGTETGIFFKDSTMANWIAFNKDLPGVGIRELEINYSTGKIRAATYGRGIWEANLYNDVGINETDLSNEFYVYPNPARNTINIEVAGNTETLSVDIFNITGTLVKWLENIKPAKTISVDVANLVAGTYFIKISNRKGYGIKKVMILN